MNNYLKKILLILAIGLSISTGVALAARSQTVLSTDVSKWNTLYSSSSTLPFYVTPAYGSSTYYLQTNPSGYISGNQTITLSGDVAGSGTTGITTTIGALKVLNSMIANATIDLTTKVTGVLPVANGGTGISSFASGIATWLGSGTSADLKTAVTDETGSGALVFGTSPTLTTPILGVASSTALTVSGALYGNTAALSSTLNVTGQTTLVNASTTALTAPTFWSTLATITKGIFTNASSTNFTLTGLLYDSILSKGTAGQVLTSTGTSTLWAAPTASTPNTNWFGDGSDGDVVIAATTTLTRDMYYNNLTINTGVAVQTAGYAVYVKGTLTQVGTGYFNNKGSNGGNGGNGGNGSGSTPGTAGTAGTAGTGGSGATFSAGLNGRAGGPGGVGGYSPEHPSAPAAASNGSSTFASVLNTTLSWVNGATGGSGGPMVGCGCGGAAAGTAGNAGSIASSSVKFHDPASTRFLGYFNAGTYRQLDFLPSNGGSSGGGGGSGWTGGGTAGGAGGGGGGGGGNGGWVGVYAYNIVTASNRLADVSGGNGGTGGNGGNAATTQSGNGGGGAGGIGGNGGFVIFLYSTLSGSLTATVSAGTGGTGGSPGATSGRGGTSGSTGSSGVAGYLFSRQF